MAVHGGLTGATHRGDLSLLVAVREVALQVPRLDTVTGPLDVEARKLIAVDGSLVYEFWVRGDGQTLANGRVTVMKGQTQETG
jgi:predicted hotdog family 3-hydroxylacyl-ACP dehydratase